MASCLLIYPPLQFARGAVPKPDGSLGLAYLAGSLRDAGIEVAILDAAAADFDRHEPLPSGLIRVGLAEHDIVQRAARYDVIGVASTFTAQHTQARDLVAALRAGLPAARILVGGVSARHFYADFLRAGADAVFLGEADREIVPAAGGAPLGAIPGLAWLDRGMPRLNPPAPPVDDLDRLPVPAWDLLPNEAYWSIGRPHGGAFGAPIRYAEMLTSRGCPFRCTFCHVSVEDAGSPSGPIGDFRVKSLSRVMHEIDALQGLGVDRVYVEDDSLLAKKARILIILRALRDRGLALADVNGVNLAHLFTKQQSGLVPDVDLIESLVACGFQDISLPFESASPRVLATYCSRKWSPDRMDDTVLVRACVAARLPVSGNYLIGFPDETEAEIAATIEMARRHRDAGLAEANFFLAVPFPGTRLFDFALAKGYLRHDWNPDDMVWFKPIMQRTAVAADRLADLRQSAWERLNGAGYVAARKAAAI